MTTVITSNESADAAAAQGTLSSLTFPESQTSASDGNRSIDVAANLLSETAHDIRSPLTGIGSALRMVCEGSLGELNELQRSTLEDAIGQCDNIQLLIDNMLQLDRLRCGLPAVRRQWITPASIQRAVESVLVSMAGPRRVEIVWQGFDDGARSIFGDFQLVRRLLLNLAGNAIAVSDERGRVMISLRPSINRGFSRLVIADHGPGITAESLVQLVRRGHSGTGGTGLGLAISMSLAALHFGRLFVSTKPSSGCRIGLELPSSGPASVADAFARWREMMAPARGLLTPHENRHKLEEAGIRIDSAEPLKPGLYKNEMQISFDGRGPRFPFQVVTNGLRLSSKTGGRECDAIDSLLQSEQRLHELVYRTDMRRWVLLWDSTEEEAAGRLSKLDQRIRDEVGIDDLSWQFTTMQTIAHRGDRAKIRECLIRDTLHASSRSPMFEDVFARDGEAATTEKMNETMARRLEQELMHLNRNLRRQSKQLAKQAADLNRLMD